MGAVASSSVAPIVTNANATTYTDVRDGWDNDEWASLEEEPVRQLFSFLFSVYFNF